MPPTPFQPTHQTPFKSTVSTSQQSRIHHTSFEGAISNDLSISIADINPAEWKYHAEGGKNVLLSFDPAGSSAPGQSPLATTTCTFALRIPKSLPTDADTADDEEEAEQFTHSIVEPLLGNPSVLPRCIKIPVITARDRDIIDTLSARIEMQRPATRRSRPARIRSEALSCIYAVEDVTAPILASSSSQGVLSVEIKPKWGFLPRIDSLPPSSSNVEIKGRYSRYRMHRVAKHSAAQPMSKEHFEQLYDPLDLYSQDPKRKQKAVAALYKDWQETNGKTNNLRLFWNGAVVAPDDRTSLAGVAQFFGVLGADTLLDALTHHIVEELSMPTMPAFEGDSKVDMLTQLAHLQSALDPLDVEGLAQLWLARTQSHVLGQSPTDLPPSLTTPLPSSQLLPLLQPFLDRSAQKEVTLEDALQAFLVSATFKDCSLLLRFVHTAEGKVEGETKLVDLDRKPWSKLSKMQETDAEVCASFLAWLASVVGEPAASVPV
ncbi:Inositol-pentakisphosphate 2-kinase [Kalmanozyma brasiliensis GHG001]|nr:Inositol-pentakisphosphate 2-kinase [Kalmanozyma brasiliensis GHG001]EST09149.2 Inositol-pentakisphosphate 2-kinase [Kalmanozyma brasiliensis GHG001]